MPNDVDRQELEELLEEVFAHGPDMVAHDGPGPRCFWCHADVDERHGENCVWLRVADVLGQGEHARLRAVGDDDEEWADRANGDLPAPVKPRRRTARPRPPHALPADDPAPSADIPPEFDAAAAEVLAQFERDVAELGAPQPGTLDLLRDAAARISRSGDPFDDLDLDGEEPLVPVPITEE